MADSARDFNLITLAVLHLHLIFGVIGEMSIELFARKRPILQSGHLAGNARRRADNKNKLKSAPFVLSYGLRTHTLHSFGAKYDSA